MKKKRNVYTIQSLSHQTKNIYDKEKLNFQKNDPDFISESHKKAYNFQRFGAGDSFFNQCLAIEKENNYIEEIKSEENEKNRESTNKEIIKVKDSFCEIHKTSKLTNLAKIPLSKNSIDFLFGPKENFSSSESLDENPEFLKRNFSEINLELVSHYSCQQMPVRKSF